MGFIVAKWPLLLITILMKSNLLRSSSQLAILKPEEIALIQYDSRPLEDYWLASALWNKNYCDRHGHIFIFYGGGECKYDSSTRLASPWCKVKAMRQVVQNPSSEPLTKKSLHCLWSSYLLFTWICSHFWIPGSRSIAKQFYWPLLDAGRINTLTVKIHKSQANTDYPSVKLFIYMDSDAVVDKKFSDYPVNNMLEVMQTALNWDPELKPMVFNQVCFTLWWQRADKLSAISVKWCTLSVDLLRAFRVTHLMTYLYVI